MNKPLSIVAVNLIAVASLCAQVVPDGATNTLSNVTNAFTGDVTVGTNGSFTLLVLSDNTLLTNSANGVIGANATATSNEVRLAAATARWHLGGLLFVGNDGLANRLTILNGGNVFATNSGALAIIGFNAGSRSNAVLVADPDSRWSVRDLHVGSGGHGNTLVVSNGAMVEAVTGRIGSATTASNNVVIVTGAGAVWTNSSQLRIGDLGARSQLIVSNGGAVFAGGSAFVGLNSFSTNNSVTVDGGTLRVTNAAGTSVLDVRRGSIFLNAGLVETDQLLVTNTGSFQFSGGTLAIRSSIVTNGSIFGIGDGGRSATLFLAGNGFHDFKAFISVTVAGNATVIGNGTIGGPTALVFTGLSRLAPGAPIGKIVLSNSPSLNGTVVMEISKNGSAMTNDVLQVAGALTYGGSLIVSNLGPTALEVGDRFKLFDATSYGGSFSSSNLPALGPGLSWTNKLLVDGSIEILGLIVQTLPASAISSSTATLNGLANPGGNNATAWFEWGLTTNYGNVTPPQVLGSGTSDTNFSEVLTGLSGGVTYHFRAVASNSLGALFGSDESFSPPVFANIAAGLSASTRPAAWGDYDNDGRLDIVFAGNSQVWRNTLAGFTNSGSVASLLINSFVTWGDYDNDGRLDLLLTGQNTFFTNINFILRNTSTGFTNISAGVSPVDPGSTAWGDYDNDGRLDILLNGLKTIPDSVIVPSPISEVWRNTGVVFVDVRAGLTGVLWGATAWGDYDNDGRLDIALSGARNFTDVGPDVFQILRNTGNGFVNNITGLTPMAFSSAAWGDYDNDGRLDLLVTGTAGTNAVSQIPTTLILRNTGTGFTNINAGLPGVMRGSGAWGDYDNDGRLDILLAGGSTIAFDLPPRGTNTICQVWRNTGGGFTNINAGLPGVANGTAAWGDYENDGRLDILLTGAPNGVGSSGLSQIWRNNTPLTNTPPTAPTGLSVATSLSAGDAGSTVILSWNTASDAQTPATGLTYNVRIGTTPGASDVMGPMSSPSGFRRLPQTGNAQGRLFARFNAAPATTYFWSVQAVDTAFAGGPFAPEQSFTINTVFTPTSGVPVPGDQNGDGIVSQSEFAAVITNLNGNGIVTESELNLILSNYFPNSPWLYLTNLAGLGGTNVTFALTNDLAGAFSVEFTTNFVDWYFLGPATPRYEFTDTNAPAVPQRSYRLRWP